MKNENNVKSWSYLVVCFDSDGKHSIKLSDYVELVMFLEEIWHKNVEIVGVWNSDAEEVNYWDYL